MEILLRHKKNEILPSVTTWMDFEGITLSETNQKEKDNTLNGFTHMWNVKKKKKKKRTNTIKQKQRQRYRDQTSGSQRGRELRMGQMGEGDQWYGDRWYQDLWW